VQLLALAPRQVEQKRQAGALLVDVRTDQQFDDAHIPGAICNPMLRAGFGSKLAWLADREQEVVLIGRDDEDGRRAGQLAVAVGIRKLGGYLHGGMTNWRQEKREAQRIKRMPIEELAEHVKGQSDDLQILDVRERSEWDDGHVPGSVFEAWHDITGVPDGLDPARPVAVVCGSGQRAATAASLLERFGAEHVVHVVDGGVPRLSRLGIELEAGERSGAPA
jgi:hydroxyacylglutathione hydrolase